MDSPEFTEANTKTPRGWNALHYAAAYDRSSVIHVLVTHPAFDPVLTDPSGRTALHIGAEQGHAEVVKALLQYPRFSAVEDRDSNGATALTLATGEARAALQNAATLFTKLR